MRTLVAYLSQTGNTKKVAEAIYEVLPDDKEILPLAELDNLEGYDLVFFGSPIQAMAMAKDAADFLSDNVAGKRIAVFLTHGAPEDADRVEGWLDDCRELVSEGELVGIFSCQGEVAQEIIDFLLQSDNPEFQQFGREAPQTKGQPDETRLNRAREFARDVLAGL